MPFAPQQNWALFDERARSADSAWLRSLDVSDRFNIYCDLFNVISQSRDPKVDWQRVEAEQWREKLATRLRMVGAFKKLDELRASRSS